MARYDELQYPSKHGLNRYRAFKHQYDIGLGYDLDQINKEILKNYIENGKKYTNSEISLLIQKFPQLKSNKNLKFKLCQFINNLYSLNQLQSQENPVAKIKIDILTKPGSGPNLDCSDYGSNYYYDASLNTCVYWPINNGDLNSLNPGGDTGGNNTDSWNNDIFGDSGHSMQSPSDYLIGLLYISDSQLISFLQS